MIGFTAASGQVKLASRPVLGQVSDTASFMAAAQEQELAKLITSINTLPETQRPSLMAEVQKCTELIAGVRAATSDQDMQQKAFTANNCLVQLDGYVKNALAQAPKTAAPAPAVAQPAAVPPSGGAPTWAYVLGGVVLAGALFWAFAGA